MLEVNVEGWRRAVGGRAPTTSAKSRDIINSSAASGETQIFVVTFEMKNLTLNTKK